MALYKEIPIVAPTFQGMGTWTDNNPDYDKFVKFMTDLYKIKNPPNHSL